MFLLNFKSRGSLSHLLASLPAFLTGLRLVCYVHPVHAWHVASCILRVDSQLWQSFIDSC